MENEQTIYNIIKNTEFSEFLSDKTMLELSRIMDLIDYEPNTIIYSKNKLVTKFLIIKHGKAKIIDDNSKTIRELDENDFFGLISLFTNLSLIHI